MNTLTKIANRHDCDKGTTTHEAHGYTEEYGKLIPETGKCNLLEIGIWHGDSIKMWNEYNPYMKIDAIDNDPSVLNLGLEINDRIQIFIADQGNVESLSKIPYFVNYDFIVDDGSHNYDDIITSFKYLYPKLRVGGYYFIEDLHAQQAQRDKLLGRMIYLFQELTAEGMVAYWDKHHLLCNNKLLVIKK